VHSLRGSDDGVNGAGIDAACAADATRLVDPCDAQRTVPAAGFIERNDRAREELGEGGDDLRASRRTAIDGFACGDRSRVGTTGVVAAPAALGLGQQRVDAFRKLLAAFCGVHARILPVRGCPPWRATDRFIPRGKYNDRLSGLFAIELMSKRAASHSHHARQGHEHDHGPVRSAGGAVTARALWLALALTAGFALVEAVGGWYAGSLALISDAGHMVTDAAAFLIALIAQAVSQRPPSRRASYGYARAEVLAAFVNALAMLALIVWIAVEAVQRLLSPQPVAGAMVMIVAAAGMGVNAIVAWMLSRAGSSINARGALLHVFGDLLGSVAALVAGAVVASTGWTPIDPILSLVVTLLILRSTWELLRQSTGVLMERVPAHLSYDAIGRALATLPGVTGVHDLHVWYLSPERVALSAHLTLAEGETWLRTLASAQRMLARDFRIDHVTLQPSWPAKPTAGRVIPVAPVAGAEPGSRLH
jgi:cobalt-zinc-cadmium efflux system protein